MNRSFKITVYDNIDNDLVIDTTTDAIFLVCHQVLDGENVISVTSCFDCHPIIEKQVKKEIADAVKKYLSSTKGQKK